MSRKDTRTAEERELAEMRDASARHDARMNETLTRGELLDAFGTVRYTLNQSGSSTHAIFALLDALESAFQ